MGIDADRFVYVVPQGAYCIFCNLVLEDPIEIIKCGHYVCSHCWDTWLENNKNTAESTNFIACPYCNVDINPCEVRKSKITWCLIQNLNVYCPKKCEGCESVYKFGFEDLHSQKCPYQNKTNSVNEQPKKCDTCSLTLDATTRSHSCVKELIHSLKKQSTEISNLEHENNRLVFKLATCEKEFMEERAELEGQYYEETLKHGKDIRDLRTRLACLQGELSRQNGQSEVENLQIDLYRVNGSLGFNIIGGASKDDSLSSGIYVSRIVEGGAADRPGKLRLHDCILEVDGVDLRNASHELAVKTFKNSGDPVRMVIQRTLNKNKGCDASTQTLGVVFAVTDEGDNVKDEECSRSVNVKNNKPRWLNPLEISNSVNSSGSDDGTDIISNPLQNNKGHEHRSEQYDSAYDTLLTQKSSRSSTRSPSVAEQSDCSFTTQVSEKPSTTTDNIVLPSNITSADSSCNSKRHSTFFVLPSSNDQATVGEQRTWHDLQIVTEAEAEFEFEYEEVNLRKEGGKLGMVLCYGGDEGDVAVYVGDIEENSVADNSGKIMVGDQIVQINGCHVNNVAEAYTKLQEFDEISLVVARAIYEQQTDCYDEAEETDLDMLDCINEESDTALLRQTSKTPSPNPTKKIFVNNNSSILGAAPPSSNSVPSSPPQQIPSEIQRSRAKTLSPVHHNSPKTEQGFHLASAAQGRGRSVSVSDSLDEKETAPNAGVDNSEAQKVMNENENKNEKIESKESIKTSLKNFVKNKLGTVSDKIRPGSHSDDSCDMKIPRCDSNSSSNSFRSNRSSEKENSTPHEQLKAKLKDQKNLSKLRAYLDSPSLQRHRVNKNVVINQNHHPSHQMTVINSTPQFLYPGHLINVPVFTQVNPIGLMQPGSIPQYQPLMIRTQGLMNINSHKEMLTKNHLAASVSSLRSAMKNSALNNILETKQSKKVQIDPHPGWNETERRVWEEFKIIQSMESKQNDTQELKMDPSKVEAEWRVRRSKDGKHVYIKKTNSARTKILKEREQQINEERCGITTDDDAFTVYQGKYWKSDQRKKQLHRHNDRRKKIMEKVAIKASYENKTEKAMAEMVQRRMMPGTVFDNFVTIEEILSQRNRAGIFDGPIHVTTI